MGGEQSWCCDWLVPGKRGAAADQNQSNEDDSAGVSALGARLRTSSVVVFARFLHGPGSQCVLLFPATLMVVRGCDETVKMQRWGLI
jgi:hypothetical protein